MSEADKRNRQFPTSQKGDKIDHGADALAEMNKNRRVLDSGPKVWHNPRIAGDTRGKITARQSASGKSPRSYRAHPPRKLNLPADALHTHLRGNRTRVRVGAVLRAHRNSFI